MINCLHDHDDAIVLVLDDYHVITDTQIHRTVDFLIQNRPHCLQIAIATRSDPPLALSRLRTAPIRSSPTSRSVDQNQGSRRLDQVSNHGGSGHQAERHHRRVERPEASGSPPTPRRCFGAGSCGTTRVGSTLGGEIEHWRRRETRSVPNRGPWSARGFLRRWVRRYDPDDNRLGTVLEGRYVDQSSLHGLLDRLRDLGIEIVSFDNSTKEGRR